ncbi:MAG: hypothetical protein K0S19_1044, partial [Geminicoccaceae bacterium]|nr:hypothetical protein [Geminicoccaceae bacterium]
IPTRSRHLAARAWHCATVLSLLMTVLGGSADLGARQAASSPRSPATPPDTAQRRSISPMGALWRSLLIPGWGQARLNRKLTGGIFVAWEGVTLGMSLKTRHELEYLRRNNSPRGDAKRQEHEDWLVLLAFNHLLSGLEAYVSAHLTDFPGDLQVEALPDGVGAGMSLPIRIK